MNKYDLIDTHCHLYLDDFSADLPEYMDRAFAAGVRRIYLPALDRHHFKSMVGLENKYPGTCISMIGIHPCYVRDNYGEELDFILEVLNNRQFAAIGEVGLDYYWDRSYEDQQMTCFIEQIGMARKHNLPVVIHSRNSMDETIHVIQAHAMGLKGIFHCFSGNLQNATDITEAGFMIGIGGVITYKNSGLGDVLKDVSMEHIVLETDAPYLTPVPFRESEMKAVILNTLLQNLLMSKAFLRKRWHK